MGAMTGLEPAPPRPYSNGAGHLYVVNGALYPLSYIALIFQSSSSSSSKSVAPISCARWNNVV